MSKIEVLKIACIGAGYFSQFHYAAWRRIENVELIASVDESLESAAATQLAAFTTFDEMLSEVRPDIVDIITPSTSHLDYIKLALKAGVKAIICQKPFCNNLDEANEAVRLSEKYNTPIIIHENFRFQPWYRIMKKEIEKGTLGDIHQLTFRLRTGDGQGKDAYLDRQPYFQKMEKFLIHETGVHWIDTFRYLMGKPKAVYADLRKMNPNIAGEDAGYFIMEFEDGKQALFDANRHLDHRAENCRTTFGECLLEGTKGTIVLYGNGCLELRLFDEQKASTLLEAKSWHGFAGDCVYALQAHVIDGLTQNKPIENLASDYLRVLEIEHAIYSSDKSASKVIL